MQGIFSLTFPAITKMLSGFEMSNIETPINPLLF